MTDKVVVLMTCKTAKEGERIARHLLGKHLIACANLVPQVRSIYHWEGKIADEKECWMLLKSTRELMPALRVEVEKESSYAVPELIALPIIDGSPNYLNWLGETLASAS
jgi:periplasmic divalent cation tolerance protein